MRAGQRGLWPRRRAARRLRAQGTGWPGVIPRAPLLSFGDCLQRLVLASVLCIVAMTRCGAGGGGAANPAGEYAVVLRALARMSPPR